VVAANPAIATVGKGRFITFEGGEGSGKSTQVGLLVAALTGAGIPCQRTREPGGAVGAEQIRELLVSGEPGRWDALTEALLVTAARRDHLVKTIWPALEAGTWVVSDRFADSTLAYQGFAGGVPQRRLRQLYRAIAGGFAPDLTLILDLPPGAGLDRALDRARQRGATGGDRFERKGAEFHDKLRAGFLAIARREPERCVVIEATQTIEAVHRTVWRAAVKRLGIAL
jgi:dTMP kinase